MTLTCITGSTGFIGGALAGRLAEGGAGLLLTHSGPAAAGIGELARRTQGELARALAGVDAVYHLAGLAEGARRVTTADFDAVNHALTLRLYRAACDAGVRNFIWTSTIKVLGEVAQTPLAPEAAYAPAGAYAKSKAGAERALLAAADGTTRVVIVRPPLVYGPGVGGNFASLMRLCRSGLPLPLAVARARRSMVGLANLVDFLAALGAADLGAAEILHVRDAQEWRIGDLAGELQRLYGRPGRQFALSGGLMESVAGRLGIGGVASRLFHPLRVDAASSERRVGWKPPYASQQLLKETVAWTAGRP